MENRVEVGYLGQTGFVFRLNDVQIAADPYLSDYVDRTVKNVCWKRNYPPPCTPAELSDVDLVLLSHSHYDHTDPDTVIPLYHAGNMVFAGPYEVIDLLKSWGFNETRLIALDDMQQFVFKNQTITAVAAAHEQLHIDGDGHIRELSFTLTFENGQSVFFGGDMCLYPGLAAKIVKPVTAAILPINGRDENRRQLDIIGNLTYREAADLAVCVNAEIMIPTHYDLYDINAEDPELFKADLLARYPSQHYRIMQPGESFIL